MINRQKLIKKYVAAIEKAISEALKDCEQLNNLMDAAQQENFTVNMNFMIMVGDEEDEVKPKRKAKKVKPVITKEDIEFLNELGIKWNY